MERLKKLRKYSMRKFQRSKHSEEEVVDFNFKTNVDEEHFSVSWCIENIQRCSLKTGEYLESPSFSTGFSNEIKWALRMYPRGRYSSEKAGLFIHKISTNPITSVRYRLCVKFNPQSTGDSRDNKEIFSFPSTGFAEATESKNEENVPSEDPLLNLLLKNRKGMEFGESRECGTDNFVFSRYLQNQKSLHITCYINVIYVDNGEAVRNCMAGFSKSCTLMKDFKAMYENGKFSDVTLQVQDKQFTAHKAILASRSEVFDAMFDHDMKESKTNVVLVEDIEPSTMSNLLQYIYTSSVNDFTAKKAISLFSAADKYHLEELKKWCVAVMLSNLNVENVCQIAILADMHSESKLKMAINYMFRKYKHEILKRKEWNEIIRHKPHLASDILQSVSSDFNTKVPDI